MGVIIIARKESGLDYTKEACLRDDIMGAGEIHWRRLGMTPKSQPDRSMSAAQRKPGSSTTPLVTALIPAYNEARGISAVLEILRQVDLLAEIMVIDDGSQDGTAGVAREMANLDPRLRLVIHPQNRGKGEAIFTGWRATRASYLVMLDADLVDLNADHVRDLILPVIRNQADMTLGIFKGGRWATDFSHFLTPWLTGQRCFRADLLRHLPPQAASGYGLETALTVSASQRGWRCQKVWLKGVSHLPSEIHRGFWMGIRTRARMYGHILAAWFLASRWQRVVARLRMWERQG
jgi:hypothetical protein